MMKTEVYYMKNNKKKFIRFLRKNGFYLVLAVCVLGIGLGAFFGMGTAPKKQPVPTAPQSTDPPEQMEVQSVVTPQPILPTPTPQPSEAPQEEPAAQTQTVRKPSKALLAMPLKGEIIKAFSGDTLVYNPTLNMWMTHNGIDISAAKETEVTAALAGVIIDVKNDDSMGLTVTIDHGSSGRTVYAGLSRTTAEKGDKINAGQSLGTAGTPPAEALRGPHLHFEYIVGGVYADPVKHME